MTRVRTILAKVRGYRENIFVFSLKMTFLYPQNYHGGQYAFFGLRRARGTIFQLREVEEDRDRLIKGLLGDCPGLDPITSMKVGFMKKCKCH